MYSVKVVVIDSGISRYSRGYKKVKKEYCVKKIEDNDVLVEVEALDENGHGTVTSDIIFQQNEQIELHIIKIMDHDNQIECSQLCIVLEYILKYMDIDFINISAGITYIDEYVRLKNVCDLLTDKGIIIVAAYDNDGAISYPAEIPSVIGVDVIEGGYKKNDIIQVKNSCINLLVPSKFYRTFWYNGKRSVIKGTSFACAEVTGRISKLLFDENNNRRSKQDILKKIATYTLEYELVEKLHGPGFKIKKAILFPVNKEAHVILRYQDMLTFELSGIYDERVTGLVGSSLFGRTIESYTDIDWEGDFDTIILSCINKLSRLTKKNYVDEIVEKARKYHKNIYTFEKIESSYENIYFPEISSKAVPVANQMKLRKIAMPLVGVFGTSSSQGKYTVQLMIKKILEQKGYRTGFLATEPSGYLFGADSVFHFGYQANLNLNQSEYILLLNDLVWQMDKNGYDIGITGCQSATLHYDNSNVRYYTLAQQNFMFGTRPDFYVLCINPHDEISYIKRTIQYLNAVDEGKVYACALYPMRYVKTLTGMQFKKELLTKDELAESKKYMKENLDVPVYEIGNQNDMELLTAMIIRIFNGEE